MTRLTEKDAEKRITIPQIRVRSTLACMMNRLFSWGANFRYCLHIQLPPMTALCKNRCCRLSMHGSLSVSVCVMFTMPFIHQVLCRKLSSCKVNNLPDLVASKRQMKLCSLYKLIYRHTNFPKQPVTFRENYHDLSLSNAYSVAGFWARTNCFAHSYFPFADALWNTLTPDLVVFTLPFFKRIIT